MSINILLKEFLESQENELANPITMYFNDNTEMDEVTVVEGIKNVLNKILEENLNEIS